MSKNKKRKSGNAQQPAAKMNPEKYIREAGRKLKIYKCLADRSESGGLAQVLVIRERPNEQYVVGIYLIDTFCLGCKSTMFKFCSDSEELAYILNHFKSSANLQEVTPNHAFNLIYGGVEYAEDLGFAPDKNFAITEYLLDPVESIEYEEIEFGKDGKPFYISGPYDNAAKIMNTLAKSKGEGNYNFMVDADELDFHNGEFYRAEDIDEDEDDDDEDAKDAEYEEVKE